MIHQIQFIPLTSRTLELRQGKKLLAIIHRLKCGMHYCQIENGNPVGEDGTSSGKVGFREPTLEKAKKHVRDYLFTS